MFLTIYVTVLLTAKNCELIYIKVLAHEYVQAPYPNPNLSIEFSNLLSNYDSTVSYGLHSTPLSRGRS